MGRAMADEESALQQRRRELLRRRVAESGLSATVSLSTAPIRSGERYRSLGRAAPDVVSADAGC